MKHLLTLLCALLANPVLAQPEEQFAVSSRGVEVFGHILRHHSLRPLPSIAAATEAVPSKTMIVVFGSPLPLDLNKQFQGNPQVFGEQRN
ncbi:MAG: hypothetical protein U0744_05440 [Gemmataceae bacterium]